MNSNRIFSRRSSEKHAELLEDCDPYGRLGRAGGARCVSRRNCSEKLKSRPMPADQVDPEERFKALTKRGRASRKHTAKYSGKSIFTLEEKNRHAELTGQLDILRRRLERWKPNVLAVTNVAGPPSGPDIAPTRVLIRGNYNQPGEVVEPGFPERIHRQLGTRRSRNRSVSPISDARPSHHPGQMDCESGQSADRPRDGEPDLAASFWRRNRAHSERFRQEWRAPDASRTARLAGRAICRVRLGHQGDAQADAAVQHVSAGCREPAATREQRSGEPAASRDSTA